MFLVIYTLIPHRESQDNLLQAWKALHEKYTQKNIQTGLEIARGGKGEWIIISRWKSKSEWELSAELKNSDPSICSLISTIGALSSQISINNLATTIYYENNPIISNKFYTPKTL